MSKEKLLFVEDDVMVKKSVEDKKVERIRKRIWYKRFEEILDFLERGATKEQVLIKFFDVLDERHGFGYETQAYYARDSLRQLMKDRGLSDG